MAIHQWPQHQRPREKLLAKGAKALSDQELLAIFLRTGVSGMNAIELASKLLIHLEASALFFVRIKKVFAGLRG